jgi:fibronectin-binding autotransporter adhesin
MRRLDAAWVCATSLMVAVLAHVVIALALIGPLPATSVAGETWDGEGSNDDWTTGANWDGVRFGTSPPNDGTADLLFPATGGLVQTPLVDVPYSVRSLTFASGNGRFVILGAAELTIGAGGITNNDADIQALYGSVKLAANQTWAAPAGQLQIDAVNLNGFELTLAGTHPIDLPSLIVGAGDLALADAYASTVTMSGGSGSSNTYIGATSVTGGTLRLQKSGGATAVPGPLHISSGGTVILAASEQISHAAGTLVSIGNSGAMNLNGYTETLDALFLNGGNLTSGAGTLKIGQVLNLTGFSFISGNLSLGDVNANVTSLSQVTTGSSLIIGDVANGSLNVNTGGKVTSGTTTIGYQAGSTGAATLEGSGSKWTNGGNLRVGYGGTGTFDINAGADVSNATGEIGLLAGADGAVTVNGSGSTWTNIGALFVGQNGKATLNISNNGLVTATATSISSNSQINVTSGGRLAVTGNLTVNGTGNVTASSGGRIEAGNVFVAPSGGTATLTIAGPNTAFVQSGASTITIGHPTIGTAAINVRDGGVISSGNGAITINAAGAMLLDGAASAGTFNANGNMTVHGTLQVGNSSPGVGGALNINAGLMINGGGVHLSSGVLDAAAIEFANGGTFDFDGGTLHIDDFQNNLINQGGTLAPGHSVGHTKIIGNYTQLGAATMAIEIGGVISGQWDTISVTGNAILDGTLQVALLNGFQPVLGNSFTILTTTFGNVGGKFDTDPLPINAGLAFDVIYNSRSVVLQVVEATGLPGDYNEDGTVGAADYIVWRKNVGAPTINNRDPNGIGVIGQADYNFWRLHFGETSASGAAPISSASGAVPEPTSQRMLTLAILAIFSRRRTAVP